MDIEINAWSSFFLNLETSLILYLYPEKCIRFNQSESLIRIREIWNFARHLRFINRNGRDSLILKKSVFVISVQYPKKNGINKKLKVSTLDIRIKQTGLMVFHSLVPSSVLYYTFQLKNVKYSENWEHGNFGLYFNVYYI